jgi:molybdopterin-guanine dinucleotide biosynthesis protein A
MNCAAHIPPEAITGLVLAGGKGSRMGGVDKGLQPFRGMPMALNAMLRLQPQVGTLMLNANRNLEAYESFGAPVWPDALPDHPGPLAGFLTGLERCETPYLVTVPCDTPLFPLDLVARLAQALVAEEAEIAIAATRDVGQAGAAGEVQLQPVFCLMSASLMESLLRFVQGGQRKIDRWTGSHRSVQVLFDDADGFANANTLDELRRLESQP